MLVCDEERLRHWRILSEYSVDRSRRPEPRGFEYAGILRFLIARRLSRWSRRLESSNHAAKQHEPECRKSDVPANSTSDEDQYGGGNADPRET